MHFDYNPNVCFGSEDISEIILTTTNNVGGFSSFTLHDGLIQIDNFTYALLTDSSQNIAIGEHELSFSWTGSNNCTTDSTIVVNVIGNTNPIMVAQDKYCINTIENQFYIQADNIDHVDWIVSNENKSYSKGTNTDVIYIDWLYPTIETVTAKVFDIYNCQSSVSKKVYVAAPPVADFDYITYYDKMRIDFTNLSTQDSTRAYGESILPELTSYWNFNYPDSDTVIQTTDEYDDIISHYYRYGYWDVKLKVVNDFGCFDTITKKVFMDVYSNLYVPNALAPNNQSHEVNSFLPKGIALLHYEIWIYDKWGNLIWYSDKLTKEGSPAEAWDGKYDNTIMQMGAYFWIIDATLVDGSKWKGIKQSSNKYRPRGSVYLIR